jgi:hypothetical protein
MAAKLKYSATEEQQLMARLWSPEIKDDPYAFVMFVFPWGQKGTPLEHQPGPRTWQKKALLRIKKQIADNKVLMANGKAPLPLRVATASGRGIGKSSLVNWLILWMMSCNLGSTTIVAANTEAQLKSRTWAELGKWHTLAINSHWFDRDTLSLRPAAWFRESLVRDMKIDCGYYYALASLWTEENPDAFAGVHNHNGILLIFDEASGIPQSIFNVSEGFFTEPVLHRYWFCYSNPRRNTGAFFELFHKLRNYWEGVSIDSREVEGTDKAVYQQIIDQYGEDSDEARVEVRGLFPSQGDKQFISRRLVDEAIAREVSPDSGAPLVMGVDVARFGDDQSVIYFRHGRDGRSFPPVRFKGLDTAQLAARVAELADRHQPDGIFVDGAGVGGGVVDQLRALKYRVHDVQFGAKADEDTKYQNKRVECWARMREWLQIGCVPDISELADDFLGPEYEFDNAGRVKLESKDKMKGRGLASPDIADALALTFAMNLPRRDSRLRGGRTARMARGMDYSVLG